MSLRASTVAVRAAIAGGVRLAPRAIDACVSRAAVTSFGPLVRSSGASLAPSTVASSWQFAGMRSISSAIPPAASSATEEDKTVADAAADASSTPSGSSDPAPAADVGAAEESKDSDATVPLWEHEEMVQALNDNIKELTDSKLRMLADMENTRRIAKRDVDTAKEYAVTSFAKQMLEVSDNLQMALDSVPVDELEKNSSLATLHEGITLTHDILKRIFNAQGVSAFGEVGDPFDPNVHDALFEAPDPSVEPGCVSQVIQKGYMIKGRVLRPAKVGASKAQ